ncbi:MAG: type II toxin-antitoxin system prevent-host-death family antitoxin [Saccharofermentanales bacterium]
MIATASEMKNNFGQYLKYVTEEDGEVIITKNNARVARLVPYVSDIERYYKVCDNAAEYQYDMKTVSYDEFMEIYENSNSRMEFINGQIYMMASPSLLHQYILGEMHVIFKDFFRGKKCKPFMAPFDVHFRKINIKDPDVMQPDLIVLCDVEGNVNEKGKYMGTPTLVVEILSPNSRSRDCITKLNTYMTSGVDEFWVVDPDRRTVQVYNFSGYQYDSLVSYKADETAVSSVFEGLSVPVGLLFAGF